MNVNNAGDASAQSQDRAGASRLVPAIARAVAILDLIADSNAPRGVSEIARALQLPKSSVHGICETLVARDLVRSLPGGFVPGPRTLRWSSAFLRRSSLVSEFFELLASEPALAGYTSTLSVLEQDNVVYLGCRNSNKPLGFTFQVGQHLPSVFTATGKAMLAAMPAEQCAAQLPRAWPQPLTMNSVADAAAFDAQLRQWRALGYAVDDGEVREGMVCIGAAVLDAAAQPIAGIAASLTAAEARPEIRAEIGQRMRAAARRLSELSGLGSRI